MVRSARSLVVSLAALALSGTLLGVVNCGGGSDDELITPRRTKGGAGGASGASGEAGASGATAGAAGIGAAGEAGAGAAGETSAGAPGDAGAAGAAGDPGGSGGAAGGDGGQAGQTGLAGEAGSAGAAAAGEGGQSGQAGQVGGGEIACADGVDNDTDGLADCADSDCVGRSVCLPAVPSDWTGPLTTFKRPSTVDPTPCSNGVLPKRRFLTKGKEVHCSPCACGDREGASCKIASVEIKTGDPGNTTCAGVAPIDVSSASCGEFDAPTTPPGLSVRASLAEVKGSCPASGGVVDNRPPVFQESYDTCPLAGGGVGCGTSTCVPLSNEAQTCILHAGVDAFCPSGWNTRIVVFDDADDNRGCTTCSCDDPATVCGKAKLELQRVGGCGIDANSVRPSVDVDGTCTYLNVNESLPGTKWHLAPSGVAVTSTSCTPSGGQPTGDVSPKNGSVLCCL